MGGRGAAHFYYTGDYILPMAIPDPLFVTPARHPDESRLSSGTGIGAGAGELLVPDQACPGPRYGVRQDGN